MLKLIEGVLRHLSFSNFLSEKFTQSPATEDDESSVGMMLMVFILVVVLRLLLVYALGSYLYNMSVAKSFGVKEITGTQAVALSILLDVLM
uniref:Uncharacterized protein n=1 Tax=viral metagenome TaxID=1070528 RepID=A0A6C0F8W5_9ZZZZ|tara:strand:+ start:259 stop:531 length:273 start_codon:yes stop_codon:yes gene_type:complete